MEIDTSLYPELAEGELPTSLDTPEARADYLHRLCAAWDFYGFVPTESTLEALEGWREVFEAFPLPSSPAYHGLCHLFAFPLPAVQPYLGVLRWEELDRAEGRPPDPFLGMV